MSPYPSKRGRACLLALFALLVGAEARAAEYSGRTPPRLSLVEGQVSFWRGGGTQWEDAQVNLPVDPGDSLATGASSRAELQIGAKAFVRLDGETQVGIDAHDGGLLRLDLSQGRVAVDLRDVERGASVEVRTPQGKLAASAPGFYDVSVGEERTAFVARQGGRATVFVNGTSTDLGPGSELVAGDAPGGLVRYAAPSPDDWDRWNSERTDRILSATSRGYVAEDVYGIHDLDRYGAWREEPEYGRVWVPANVPPSWAPYTDGRWLWSVDYGWSWVDASPWGWAPYHYGRWVWLNSSWGWAPGPRVAAPVYAPALVAFFGGPSISVSVGFPFVSWVALGWGEPVIPWWGPSWYRGAPCWNGWGGPTIINNVFVQPDGGYHHHVDHYRNEKVPNAMVAVRRRDFGRRSTPRVGLDAVEQGRLRPTHGGLPVQPQEVGVERPRPSRPDRSVNSSRVRPPSPYGERQVRARDAVSAPNSGFADRPAPGMQGGQRARPERPLSPSDRPRREEASFSPQSPDRPQPNAGARSKNSDFASRARPRPAPPERPQPVRPMRERPSRPAGQDAYAPPSYDAFHRAPRPDTAPAPVTRPLPRAGIPAASSGEPAAAPHQRPASSYGDRAPARPAMPSVQMPSVQMPSVQMPSHPGGGGDSGGGGAPSGSGSAPTRSHSMGMPQVRPHHSR